MKTTHTAPPKVFPGPRGFGPSTLGYYALLVLAALLGLALLGYLFFIWVGYVALPLLIVLIALIYLGVVTAAGYALTRTFNPTRRVLWVGNVVLLLVALALGALLNYGLF